MPKRNPQIELAAKAVIEKGISQIEAAERYGCSPASISLRLRKTVYRRSTGGPKKRSVEMAFMDVRDGLSTVADAIVKYSCSRGAVYRRLGKYYEQIERERRPKTHNKLGSSERDSQSA